MKKIGSLLVATVLTATAFSQAIGNDGPFSSSPFGNENSSAGRWWYCSPCRKYHTGTCTNPPQTTPVPLDGGLTVLLAAGAAYGVKRVRNGRQAKK